MENRISLNNKMMYAISFNTYLDNPALYDNGLTAIVEGEYAYPLRGKNDTRPGLYQSDAFYRFIPPRDEEEKRMYSADNVIDFENASSLREVIDSQNKMRSAERVILTTPDNIFIPNIKPDDSPVMKGLKEAVIMKNIDINKYEQRFGNNFNNDKRLFNNTTISLSKLETMAKALDLRLSLTIEDANENVPNPMGNKIVVELIAGDEADESE